MAAKRRRTRRSFGAVRKLPSGRYQASYLDPAGKRVNAPETFTAKIDADAWLSVQRAALETGTWRGRDNRTTVGEYTEQWLATHHVRGRSTAKYRSTYQRWIRPTFGTMALSDVTPAMVRKWVATFPDSKPAARANGYRVLAQIFRAAVDDGIISESPVRVKGASVYTPQREGRALAVSEVLAIRDRMPEDRRLAVPLAAFCALRPGEVLGLRRRDVDTRARLLNLRETASARHAGGARIGPVKTPASARQVHYPDELHAAILEHLREYAAPGSMGHLFPSPRHPDEPLSYGGFAYTFKTAMEAAGFEDVRPHDLRHTGATLAAGTGATTRELMARLGHTNPSTAMRYQHAVRERDKSIADALGAAITAAGETDEQEASNDE